MRTYECPCTRRQASSCTCSELPQPSAAHASKLPNLPNTTLLHHKHSFIAELHFILVYSEAVLHYEDLYPPRGGLLDGRRKRWRTQDEAQEGPSLGTAGEFTTSLPSSLSSSQRSVSGSGSFGSLIQRLFSMRRVLTVAAIRQLPGTSQGSRTEVHGNQGRIAHRAGVQGTLCR